MRTLFGLLALIVFAPAFGQVYPPPNAPPASSGAQPSLPPRSIEVPAAEVPDVLSVCPSAQNPFLNCGFETGDFTSWVAVDIAGPFFGLSVQGPGVSPGFGFFATTPTQGTQVAAHGFDGGGPGNILIAQDLTLPAGTTAVVFDYRAAWDMQNFGGSTLPRTFRVEIQPSGGGAPLQSTTLLTAPPGTFNPDTGPLVGSVSVTPFAGMAVRVAFISNIPENFTGPGFFQLDNVRTDFVVGGVAEDGDVTLTAPFIINSYSTIANAGGVAAGSTTFDVASAAALALPPCGAGCANSGATGANGFGTPLEANDLLMIYQPQELAGTITVANDPTFGTVVGAGYGQAGLYEFVYVGSVAGNTVTIDTSAAGGNCTGLKKSYDSGAMVIRVPQLRNLVISSGGVLTAPAWNGATGGVVVADVRPGLGANFADGNVVINGTGRIDVSALGFRGGVIDNVTSNAIDPYVANDCALGGRKGESILGFAGTNNGGVCGSTADNNETGVYDATVQPGSGAFNRGAIANGGGGGNAHNAGGGGGANGGVLASWTGAGNPAAGFVAAWNRDNNTADPSDAPTVTAASTSSGGGRGGYTFATADLDPGLLSPGCLAFNDGCNGGQNWGGDSRRNRGGLGARPLDPRPIGTDTVDRLYFGGGGGAGDGNNNANANGASGGGVVYLIAQRLVTDNGGPTSLIRANGATAPNTVGGGNDAPGGGGAGGSVVLLIANEIENQIGIDAVGGNGGNQVIGGNESEGPGGGGGGGVIAVSLGFGIPQNSVGGGANGITNSAGVNPQFPPNGATSGGVGTITTAPARNSEPLLCMQTTSGAFTTPVTNGYFKATRQNGALKVDFATSAEVGNLGFQLHGERGGVRTPIGTMIASRVIDSALAQDYSVNVADSGYDRLYLADIGITGKQALRGPFEVDVAYGSPAQAPLYNWSTARNELTQYLTQRGGSAQSAYLRVAERGMQRVSHEALVAAGIDLSGTPAAELAVIGRAGPVKRLVRGNAVFGAGSVIEFYGDPTPDLYARTETYVLRRDAAAAREMPSVRPPSLPAGSVASQVAKVKVAPQSNYSFSSPIGDPWYASRIIANSGPGAADFAIDASGAVSASGVLRVSLWGGLDFPDGALPDHHVRVLLNGAVVATRRFDGLTPWNFEIPVSNIVAGGNTLRIELPRDTGNAADLVHLESIELEFPKVPAITGGRLFTDGLRSTDSVSDGIFADGSGDAPVGLPVGSIARVTVPGLGTTTRAFRIDGDSPTELQLSPNRAIPAASISAASELWVSDAAAMFAPTLAPAPQPVSFPSEDASYWVLTHGLFQSDLGALLAHRQSQGLDTAMVDVEQIYLAYSGGNPDPRAISRFISEHAAPLGARYLVLVGGDTSDAPGYLNSGSISFLPAPYARTNEIVAYAPADPLYGDLTGDSIPEIAVGRLPVRTHAEALEAVRKIIAYETQPATSRMMLVAGAQDTNQQLNFAQAATNLGSAMPSVWDLTEVYSDALGTPAAQAAIVSGFNAGQSLISYTGHSSPTRWGFEQLLNSAQIGSLPENGNQPIVMQFGCWTTYFVSPTANTMGHALMLSPLRGASAVLGSTVLLDQPSHDAMAAAIAGRLTPGTRLGDAVQGAKRQIANDTQNVLGGMEVFVGISLLGDPAQPIR